MTRTLCTALEEDGCALLPGVLSAARVAAVRDAVGVALEGVGDEAEALRARAGGVCGARNVLTLWPPTAEVWRKPALTDLLADVLRILHFEFVASAELPDGYEWHTFIPG